MKKTLGALAMGLALATAPVPKIKAEESTLSLGLSSPSHGLVALRGVWDWNDNFGVQADVGIFSGVDLRYKKKLFNWVDIYGYGGIIGISPWMYALRESVDGPFFGLDIGAGFETGRERGIFGGVEGGLILPIPSQQESTQPFRLDINLMYKIPLKK